MPVAIRSANFLSGGQSLADASARLSAMNVVAHESRFPVNLSFSWSAALQLPLLDLCKGRGGELPLDEMAELYTSELQMASAAAKGEFAYSKGQGNHFAPAVKEMAGAPA